MRILLATTVLSAALLAACGSSAPPPPSAPAVAPIANAVTGTITLREPRELSDAAKVDIKVVDVAQPEIVLAQSTIPNAKQLPLSFNLPIDTNKVDPKRTYAVEAILTDGDRRFLQVLQHPVLTNKNPATAEVILAPEPTPAEKLFEEYKKAAAQTGNLKQISGKYSNDNFGTAWDAFTSNGKVKFVREVTDAYDDSGRTTYKIAYKDDKPWVIVRETSPVGSRTVLATTKVGWGDDGSLVIHEKDANGQTSDVSDADAKAMQAHAAAALDVAQGHAPKPQTGAQTDEKAKPAPGKKKH
ncbi:MAG: YbaY family lipoprotein [Rudaea sp.]|uniref:YbaY family lipoprotein n=1 Tax=unclassified Rudaea TaxID=2627037 RepID=UPI001484DF1F|nr:MULTISPECIES: YbaY family lipoprotein [unclassified Rudaea]MBN8885433.1 YbaY family lipoprotein [Rudaea sp.]MBR0344511.1 YbaY family lipoprotein [Rudaea sp.]